MAALTWLAKADAVVLVTRRQYARLYRFGGASFVRAQDDVSSSGFCRTCVKRRPFLLASQPTITARQAKRAGRRDHLRPVVLLSAHGYAECAALAVPRMRWHRAMFRRPSPVGLT